eukprot:SAG25_NODE_635_length_6279_cov_3.095955_4_plen_228_part_00
MSHLFLSRILRVETPGQDALLAWATAVRHEDAAAAPLKLLPLWMAAASRLGRAAAADHVAASSEAVHAVGLVSTLERVACAGSGASDSQSWSRGWSPKSTMMTLGLSGGGGCGSAATAVAQQLAPAPVQLSARLLALWLRPCSDRHAGLCALTAELEWHQKRRQQQQEPRAEEECVRWASAIEQVEQLLRDDACEWETLAATICTKLLCDSPHVRCLLQPLTNICKD